MTTSLVGQAGPDQRPASRRRRESSEGRLGPLLNQQPTATISPNPTDHLGGPRLASLVARWAFSELGLARLELTCGPDNEASQRVAARCGFVREGVLRSHIAFKGGRRDTVVFSVLPRAQVAVLVVLTPE